jgi:hypothetical protein
VVKLLLTTLKGIMFNMHFFQVLFLIAGLQAAFAQCNSPISVNDAQTADVPAFNEATSGITASDAL